MTSQTDSQQNMIRDAMKAIAERRPGRTKLVYDKSKRTIVAVAEGSQAPQALNISADDADMFGMLTLSMPWIRQSWKQIAEGRSVALRLSVWDDDDALTQVDFGPQRSVTSIEGSVGLEGTPPSHTNVSIRIRPASGENASEAFVAPDGKSYVATAHWTDNRTGNPLIVAIADVEPELNSRRQALLETTLLSDRSVLCVGLGTGGAHVAVELAKSGVGRFVLVDHDRLSVGNVARHQVGISQAGRLKVNAVRDLILERNPSARVEVIAKAAISENSADLDTFLSSVDLVICGTDNRPSKLLVNRLCVDKQIPAIFGGAFRRAYGGQILYIRPPRTPCFQCFVAAMPDEADDVEISSPQAAQASAYSDRPVQVEPGLAIDVLPISAMIAKIALVHLAGGKSSALSALSRDYDAPWFLWLNRPEPGTQYAAWPPLSESADEMTINRWYGVYFDKDAACPVCGDMASVAAHHKLDLTALRPIGEKT